MRPMTTLKTLISAVLLVGCGGGSKPTTAPAPAPEPAPEVAPAPVEPAPTPEAAKPAEPAPALALGAGKIKLEMGPDMKAEIVLNADGTFTGTATSPGKAAAKSKAKAKPVVKKKTGKLGERAVSFEGKESARLGEDGTVTVLHGMKEVRDGKVVKDESTWDALGTLDAAGVFTLGSDKSKASFGDDGKLTGIPDLTVTFEGAPEMRRTAMFLVVAMMGGGSSTVESGASTGPAAVPTK